MCVSFGFYACLILPSVYRCEEWCFFLECTEYGYVSAAVSRFHRGTWPHCSRLWTCRVRMGGRERNDEAERWVRSEE